jgi:hypothetical protein
MVERREKRAAFLKRAQAVEAHGIASLEDVTIFAMLRHASVLFDKTLDLSSNPAMMRSRGASAARLRLGEVVEFRAQFIEVEVTHSGLHP